MSIFRSYFPKRKVRSHGGRSKLIFMLARLKAKVKGKKPRMRLIQKRKQKKKTNGEKETHPIMAGKHEVISAMSSIPKRILGGYHFDVIRNKLLKSGNVETQRRVNIYLTIQATLKGMK